jgi:acetyl-CoA acetyltransferase
VTAFPDQSALRDRVAVVGVGSTRQGAHPGRGQYELALDATREALADAALDKSRIDGLLGAKQFDGSGIDPVEMAKLIGLNPRVTGALDYGTGGFTTQYAAMLIATGACETVLCVYGRNPAGAMTQLSGEITYDERFGLFNAGAVAALGWSRHMALYGSTEEALGRVVVASRAHAARNPNAAFRDPLSLDDYLAEEHLVWPFRELDICKMTAGAVALILTRAERAAESPQPPVLMHAVGRQQATRTLEDDGHLLCHGMRSVASHIYGASGLGPEDIDVLGISDASSAAVLMTLENYGFCGEGESPALLADGRIEPGGALALNTDGGQLSGGYLVGWLHQAELVRQLRGEAGERQVEGARLAQYMTTGRFRQDFLSTIYRRGEA